MICDIHNKEFKGPNTRGNYWHLVNFETSEYCNKPASEVDTKPTYTPKMEQVANEIREKITPEPDWDEIAKGKVRHGVAVAYIGVLGGDAFLTDEVKKEMEKWVDWILSGK